MDFPDEGHKTEEEEGKQKLFIECLQQKIKSWFEIMTPIPWKKSCKSNDLFVASGLVLTHSDSKRSNRDVVDPKSKLHYLDIFTHERLMAQPRIILEGLAGSGKTMLALQLAYDWACGQISDVPIVIYLPLKFVEDMTIVQAIKKFYIRKDIPIEEDDIESILANDDNNQMYVILDGLQEYTGRSKDGEPSEVMSIVTNEKLFNCTVITTTRPDCTKDLPPGPILKMGNFGEKERNEYIEKLYSDDLKRQAEVKAVISSVPVSDLSSVPLLFVLLVHNIDSLTKLQVSQLDKVAHFVKAIVDILCPLPKKDDSQGYQGQAPLPVSEASHDYQETLMSLEELAFNGLCRGKQQLLWQKDFVDGHVINSKTWIDAGILVVEEGTLPNTTSGSHPTDSASGSHKTEEGPLPTDVLSSIKQLESKRKVESMVTKTIAQYISLQMKFLHKIIQEWFAAKHLAFLFWSTESQHTFQLFSEHLKNIDPADLHYVLRFTCHICPPSFNVIASFLLREFKTGDGQIPDYIMNCIFLCFAEYRGDRGHINKEIVTEICGKEVITISSGDSQLLLRSKVSLLTFASISQVPIKHLRLIDVVEAVTDKALVLKSAVRLGVLDTLQAIDVNRWDQNLKDTDCEDLIKFIANSRSIKAACFIFPSSPRNVTDNKILNVLMSRRTSVEWIIGDKLFHTLDLKTGEWMREFRKHGRHSDKIVEDENEKTRISKPLSFSDFDDQDESRYQFPTSRMRAKLLVNREGGMLTIPDTDVQLEIPPGALLDEQLIQIRMIPHNYQYETALSFSTNSAVVVELLPSHLKLRRPVKLTLPHCLVLRQGWEWKAGIFSSHHTDGTPPRWKAELRTRYELNEHNCVMWLSNFSWKKFDVREEIVEGKNIIVYAAKSLSSSENITHVDIGFHLDVPGGEEIICINELAVLRKVRVVFYKERRLPLRLCFEKTIPRNWRYSDDDENPKELSFNRVAISNGCFCTFVFSNRNRSEGDTCICYFKVGQGPDLVELPFLLQHVSERARISGSYKSRRREASRQRSASGTAVDDLFRT